MKKYILILTLLILLNGHTAVWAQNNRGNFGGQPIAVSQELNKINKAKTSSQPEPQPYIPLSPVRRKAPRQEAVTPVPKSVSPTAKAEQVGSAPEAYTVGVEDILEISVLQPETIMRTVNVAPDGTVSFPYIGSVKVRGLTIVEIEQKIKDSLSDGYLKYPVVLVSLQESRSRKFFVYGEVTRPGAYSIEDYSTVLRAISQAGGFTQFGSSSRVKVLRPKQGAVGYDTLKIDIKKVMGGDSKADMLLRAGDMVVVSEGHILTST